MRLLPLALVLGLVSALGCATPRMYIWKGYEDDLYSSYKKPETAPEFEAELLVIIDEANKKGKKVPPGVAAEYGFAEYRRGNLESAIDYFELEKAAWPESSKLMDTVIVGVRRAEQEPQPPQEAEAAGDVDAGPPAAGAEGAQDADPQPDVEAGPPEVSTREESHP